MTALRLALLDGVPLLVGLAVEGRWSAAPAASPQAVADLGGRLRDDRADAPASQMTADGAGGVRGVGQNGLGSGPGSARAGAGHADAGHHRFEGGCITCLACGDGEGEWPCTAVCSQVDLGAQPTAGTSDRVIGWLAAAGCPFCVLRRRAGGPGRPWSPPTPSSRCRRRRPLRPGRRRGSSPRCHRRPI